MKVTKGRSKIHEFDIRLLEAELQKRAGKTKVKVKFDKQLRVMVSMRETDNLFSILINPKKIRGPRQVENCIDFCHHGII